MSMPDFSRASLTDIVGMAIRLFMRRNEVIRIAREVQVLLQEIMGPTGVQQQVQSTYDVRWVQQSLNFSMNARLAVDGQMGPRTQEAVIAFQRKHGLSPDGWVGVMTMAKLEEENAKGRK